LFAHKYDDLECADFVPPSFRVKSPLCHILIEFKWDDVKQDKFRENYLGHSLHTTRATFNDPKPNSMWYLETTPANAQDVELARLKTLEQDMMMEAL
jgi:hypothetical protein